MDPHDHREDSLSDIQKALSEAVVFNQTYKVGDRLWVRDGVGGQFQATLVSPARVLGSIAVIEIKEHPKCIFVKDIL
ncbi:hypothetical protein GCM10023189_43420 [Nibrella saemangeumensis]|uniref:Uncharacterized protein n=1 Tax=Nibrella saemangeumensis TaxID=1084526 RepID=A0ABP8NB59_9BACT